MSAERSRSWNRDDHDYRPSGGGELAAVVCGSGSFDGLSRTALVAFMDAAPRGVLPSDDAAPQRVETPLTAAAASSNPPRIVPVSPPLF